jgi:single-strand DNA-binding protein
MASVNRVHIIGNVTRDPEVKMTPTGQKVASLSVACNEKYKDQQGNQQEKVEYINIVAWRRLAEIIEQYVRKGSPLYVDGKLATRSWDDKDGNKRYKTEVIAQSIQMLSSRGDGSQSQGGSNFGKSAPKDEFGILPSDEDLPW